MDEACLYKSHTCPPTPPLILQLFITPLGLKMPVSRIAQAESVQAGLSPCMFHYEDGSVSASWDIKVGLERPNCLVKVISDLFQICGYQFAFKCSGSNTSVFIEDLSLPKSKIIELLQKIQQQLHLSTSSSDHGQMGERSLVSLRALFRELI
jgi:hypothetical protein